MTQAVAYRESQSGQEGASSGLIIHRGPLTAALVRAIGSPATNSATWPRDGQGSGSSMELAHTPKAFSSIQSYDRDTATWMPLYLNASVLGLNTQTGNPVNMPAGSAQALLGYYRATSSWAAPAAGQWYESAAQANATCRAGSVIRLEACGTAVIGTLGAVWYTGFMRDGNLLFDTQQAVQPPAANGLAGFSIIAYDLSPLAGVHRYAICCFINSGTGSFWSGSYTSLWITEQRA